ncbi:MAG: O-antigen ligase family protein [Actinomycetota bacterium]|nr:O-antigen ligase family protein [Actinomycetota bacterium]
MIELLAAVCVGVLVLLLTPMLVARPARTILPVYAATIPIGSGVKLPVPLPHPFNSFSSLLGGIAIVTMLAHLVLYRRGRPPTLPVAFWLAFLAWVTLTIFWAANPGTAVSTLLVAVPLVFLMLLAALLPLQNHDELVLRVSVILGGLLVGVYALILLFTGAGLAQRERGTERFAVVSNAATGHTNPNQVAASLLLPIAISLDLAIGSSIRSRNRRRWRLLGMAGVVFPVAAVVLSGSRGGLLSTAVVVSLVFFLWHQRPEARRLVRALVMRSVVVAALLASGFYAAVTLTPEGVIEGVIASEPIQRFVDRGTDPTGREEIWATGLDACAVVCGRGAGLGNFPDLYTDFVPFSGALDVIKPGEREAHNTYLALAVDTGMIGLTLFLLAIVVEWRALSAPHMYACAPFLKAAVIGLLVANVFEDQLWFKYFWIVFVFIRVAEGAGLEAQSAGRPQEVNILAGGSVAPSHG